MAKVLLRKSRILTTTKVRRDPTSDKLPGIWPCIRCGGSDDYAYIYELYTDTPGGPTITQFGFLCSYCSSRVLGDFVHPISEEELTWLRLSRIGKSHNN